MSTTLSAMTAAELVAELTSIGLRWKLRSEKSRIEEPSKGVPLGERFLDITAELDARCVKWRMAHGTDGYFVLCYSDEIVIRQGAAFIKNLTEFHALIGYLLAKGGGK